MVNLQFDSEGRLIGVEGVVVEKKKQQTIAYFEEDNKLMKSNELTFLKEEKTKILLKENFWSLHYGERLLEPLKFSNGKTQEDVVKEIVESIKAGDKFIYLHGVCGSGKSAIALNVARIIGKTSVVVPLKNLQRQYEADYTQKLSLYKKNGEKMKIASLTGRDNHDSIYHAGESCADPTLPETIAIAEKNYSKILDYYNKNKYNKKGDGVNIRRLRRINIAPANPYWSPIIPSDVRVPFNDEAKKILYNGADGKQYAFYHRQAGCSYYDQYLAYSIADVIMFNSAKYLAEMRIGRKPITEIEIIDEADDFLDSLFEQGNLNITRLVSSLMQLRPEDDMTRESIRVIAEKLELEEKNKKALGVDPDSVIPIGETKLRAVFEMCLRNDDVRAEIMVDDSNYANSLIETAERFRDILDSVYVIFDKEEGSIIASLVSINLKGQIEELRQKSKVMLCMSGTPHSDFVLKNIFGVDKCKFIEAEMRGIGTIELMMTGKEIDAKHSNISKNSKAREEYLNALVLCVEKAPRPTLVHVNAYNDLPTEEEKQRLNIGILLTREQLREQQANDRAGNDIILFKQGKMDTLYSTRCKRGVDFPGEICNSVIFTKYPNPNTQDIFWQILKQQHKNIFWEYYMDKAKRDFRQRIYRAVRSPTDHVYVLSPDIRVLQATRQLQEEMMKAGL